MHTEHKREEPLVDLGYEIRDIDYKGLGKVSILFIVFVTVMFGGVWIWFVLAKPQISSSLDPTKPIPTIALQSNISVRADIQTLRQHETDILTHQGQNPDGSLRIPIDQAMNIIASRGLAAKTTEVPAVSPHNTIKQNALPPGGTTSQPAMSGDIGAGAVGGAKP